MYDIRTAMREIDLDNIVSITQFFEAAVLHTEHRVLNCSSYNRVGLACLTCDIELCADLLIPIELQKYPFVSKMVQALRNLSYSNPGASLKEFIWAHAKDLERVKRLSSFI